VTTVHRLVDYYFGFGFGGIGTGRFGVGLKLLEENVRSALDSSSDKKQLRLDAPSLGQTTDGREVGCNEVVFGNCTSPFDRTERIINVVSAVDGCGVGLKSEHWTKHAQNRVNAGLGYVVLALLVGGCWLMFMLMPESSNLDIDLTLAITDSAESDDGGRRTLESYRNGVDVEDAKEKVGRSHPRRDSSGNPDSNDNDADPDGDDNDPPPSDSGPGLHEDDNSDRVGWKFLAGKFVLGYMAAGVRKVVRRPKARQLVAPVRRGDQQSYEIELDYSPEWDVLRGAYRFVSFEFFPVLSRN
jgi:hypothetical protein